jgi:hypothetical protein
LLEQSRALINLTKPNRAKAELMRYQFTLRATRRRHVSGFSLKLKNLKKANIPIGRSGGTDEAYETRFHGWLGGWYHRTLRYQ